MAELLAAQEIEERLGALEDWHRDGEEIVRDVECKDFAGAIALVNAVAAIAQEANHHPDILVHGWNKLRLRVTNHSAGGLTQADFDLAATIDRLPGIEPR
jgi:4a-hydroxytetrahydrobiopterin dehydratase